MIVSWLCCSYSSTFSGQIAETSAHGESEVLVVCHTSEGSMARKIEELTITASMKPAAFSG